MENTDKSVYCMNINAGMQYLYNQYNIKSKPGKTPYVNIVV